MIDLLGNYNPAWSGELRPIGEGRWQKEPFDKWWDRNKVRLGLLHPRIAEQWGHRHWQNSPFCHLDLDRITWRSERWPTQRLLAEVVRPDSADETSLAHDYALYRDRESEPSETMRATGTWDIPIVIIDAPNGVLRSTGPDTRRFYLIEGHQRMRCLAAFHRHAKCANQHKTFIISYPEMVCG